MFKTPSEVETFVNSLEKFILAVIANSRSFATPEDAGQLNRMRHGLEEYITQQCNIVERPNTYDCPDCGNMMIQRKNRETGNVFWGCVKYPNCRGTRDEFGLSKAEREEQKQKEEN